MFHAELKSSDCQIYLEMPFMSNAYNSQYPIAFFLSGSPHVLKGVLIISLT